ncbi:bifunctional transaldolase/phosoglucose isomerase [Nitrospira defluvii]|uniref:Transaldolase n=1 Tax=Nitrospira defluvii TaxID=330214 RepID=A0ABM8RAR5_9BACT|nr:bifunctional transaldolase/phosoglucose isomerase [Nitrospira defluvii]CAE6742359.1 Transaldolase [Nitrospira defluvii]
MMYATQVRITNPVRALQAFGQSVWLDYIQRSLITSGALQRLILEEGVVGVTSNPAIFEKAITGSSDYADALSLLRKEPRLDAKAGFERLAIEDIQSAADLLQPVYARTKRRDGYVSLEVSPLVAHDTQGTLQEAKRLWEAVGRDNLMIKVPATPAGIPAIEQLIGMGINVNVTLLFAQETYALVADAYLAGLEQLARRGGDLGGVASVASFFISRIDTAADAEISVLLKKSTDEEKRATLRGLQGKIAVANAKLAYQRYQALFSGSRWDALARLGATTQRLLWASTGTKNPRYRDVQYVEELIGPETVNTVPPATLDAFRDHGHPASRLTKDLDEAKAVLLAAERAGLSMTAITDRLLEEGLQSFSNAFDHLLVAVESHVRGNDPVPLNSCSYSLPTDMAAEVQSSLKEWNEADRVRRLWNHDPSLWTDGDEHRWLGWLDITDQQLAHVPLLTNLAGETWRRGFTHILLLGMGGSSLCPEVLRMTFGRQAGYPELHVLDSTDPAQIRTIEKRIQIASTLFIVSSKSGSTLEPMILKHYFFERVQRLVGVKAAVRQFIAITDPGSPLQQIAEANDFRHLYFGVPTIGGRYSALSNFGMVPAAVMGLDIAQLLESAEEMVEACFPSVPVKENPGLILGATLGVLAKHGRDKVTIVSSPDLASFGAWLEQLLAESTGKAGKGIIPVDREPVGHPAVYGADRVFIYIRLQAAPEKSQDVAINRLEREGHPIVRITVSELYDLGQEFFRWEFATAVAGAIMGLNPFDQPDVEASKLATKELTAEYERTGALPEESPIFEEGGIKLFADPGYAHMLQAAAGPTLSLGRYLAAHLNLLATGEYFALLAYLEMDPSHEAELQAMRLRVRDAKRVATCVGFGPRFLHSTGQAYKGGPNTGLFLQITCEDAVDLRVPGQSYTFGVVKAAQARGDFQVLTERDRRLLRVHLGTDVHAGLARLRSVVEQVSA